MGARSTGRVAALLTAALVAGCATGPGDAGNIPVARGPVPSHPVPVNGPTVSGTVRDSAGHPVPGATVIVAIALTGSEKAARNIRSFASLGLACLDRPGCTTPTSTGRVAGDGRFVVAAPHGQVAKSDGYAVTVVAARGANARVATTVFVPRRAGAGGVAGSIPLAAAPPRLGRAGGRERLVLPGVDARVGDESVVMSRAEQVAGSEQFVQRPPTTDVSGGYDPRLVEDGQVLLVGTQSGRVHGQPAEFSASLVTSSTEVPPSRGASCYVEGSRGQRIAQRPCGLTDGVLDADWSARDDPRCDDGPCKGPVGRDHRDVTVLLARAMPAALLVVRGCGFTCRVGISTDGRHFGSWREASSGSADDVFVDRLAGARILAVRVETATGGFFSSLREVSVFG